VEAAIRIAPLERAGARNLGAPDDQFGVVRLQRAVVADRAQLLAGEAIPDLVRIAGVGDVVIAVDLVAADRRQRYLV
jgi:hypothetical protein